MLGACKTLFTSAVDITFVLYLSAVLLLSTTAYAEVSGKGSTSTCDEKFESHPMQWQIGAFASGGFVPDYWAHGSTTSRSVELIITDAGISGGKILTAVRGSGIFRGEAEANVEFSPFFRADYPPQTQHVIGSGFSFDTVWGPYTIYGASLTPALIRWNFMQSQRSRFIPWAQVGGGLLWTNHKFPYLGYSTSVFNFTPQIGFGESIFVKPAQTLDFSFKVVNINNAGLGDSNPGVNYTLQFGVGYSWWK